MVNKADWPRRPYPWRRQFYQEELVFNYELSVSESGVLYRLSLHAWPRGGELPSDAKVLSKILRIPIATLEKSLKKLHELGIIFIEHGSLRIYHIDRELRHASKRSAAGVTAARTRWVPSVVEDAG